MLIHSLADLTYFPLRPLHVAARNGLTVVVQELLAKGASVLAVDENGKILDANTIMTRNDFIARF